MAYGNAHKTRSQKFDRTEPKNGVSAKKMAYENAHKKCSQKFDRTALNLETGFWQQVVVDLVQPRLFENSVQKTAVFSSAVVVDGQLIIRQL